MTTTRGATIAYILTVMPIILAAVLGLVVPGLFKPTFANPPSAIGLPLGVLLVVLPLIWAGIGMLLALKGRSVLAVVGFALPSLIALLAWVAFGAFLSYHPAGSVP